MDKDFADTFTNGVVPVIKSESENPIYIESLETGVYVLSGTFALHSGQLLRVFEYNPLLCHVYKDGDYTYVYYQSTVFAFEDITIQGGVIVSQVQYLLDGFVRKEDVCPLLTDEREDYDDTPVSGSAVKEYINNKIFSQIYMESEDGKKRYTITIGTDGNLKVTE